MVLTHFSCIAEMPNNKEEGEAYKNCVNILRDLQEILDFLGGWCTYKAALVIKENIGMFYNLFKLNWKDE